VPVNNDIVDYTNNNDDDDKSNHDTDKNDDVD